MNKINIEEIMSLYKKCGLDGNSESVIRNTFNKGTLNNKLNSNWNFWNNSEYTTINSSNTNVATIPALSHKTLKYLK